jgi:hypothetical protein
MFRNCLQPVAAVLTSMVVATSAMAIPMTVTSQDDPLCCDTLNVPMNVHELGIPTPPFPQDEKINAQEHATTVLACPPHAMGIPSRLVEMINLTGINWKDVWYVADTPDTRITNRDGFVNGADAFKIDKIGINTPLVFEGMNPDGIFEAGEIWGFVIDGYQNNFGLPASAFNSVGVGSFSVGDQFSSGSIIAVAVPEPGCVVLALVSASIGACGLLRRRYTT